MTGSDSKPGTADELAPAGGADAARDEADLPGLAPSGAEALDLVRTDSDASRRALRRYSPEQLADAAMQLPARQRHEFLEGAERVEEIVPCLPEAEFLSTVRTVGIADAGWLVEFASSEQRVAAIDLDCWKDRQLSSSRLFEWIDAMIEAGSETLARSFDELDPEVWILAMQEMADFRIADGDAAEWLDGLTEDGLVYYEPRSGHEDRVREILQTALLESPSHYWGFVYGAMLETREECEEYAARWHRGRLEDLGFPDREHAMRAYRPLRVESAPPIDVGEATPRGALVGSAAVPDRLSGTLVGRALAELPAARAGEVLGAVLGVANTLAVADELPLGEPESVETALRKALRGIDLGLAALSRDRDEHPAAVLDAVTPLDLFRIGVGLDATLRSGKTVSGLDAAAVSRDWDVESEMIEIEDMTIAPDGRPR